MALGPLSAQNHIQGKTVQSPNIIKSKLMFVLASLKERPSRCNLELEAVFLKNLSSPSLNSLSHSHLPTKSLLEIKPVILSSLFLPVSHSWSKLKPCVSHLLVPSLISCFLWLPLPSVLRSPGPTSFQKACAPRLLPILSLSGRGSEALTLTDSG